MSPLEDGRPPFVQFEMRGVEDRARSIEAGSYIEVEVPHVLVQQLGSREQHVQVADDWFKQLQVDVNNKRLSPKWLEGWKIMYENFKQGETTPVNGTSLKMFPVIRPAQMKQCFEMGVFTVEDLAGLNSEGWARLGIGGQTLSQKAKDWLSSASDKGTLVSKLEEAVTENTGLKDRVEALQDQLEALKKLLPAGTTPQEKPDALNLIGQ